MLFPEDAVTLMTPGSSFFMFASLKKQAVSGLDSE